MPPFPDLTRLPTLPYPDWRAVPYVAAVYFVLGIDRQVYYIGQTSCLRMRFASHHLRRQFRQLPSAAIAWLACPVPDLRYTEALMIAHFQPTFNGIVPLVPLRTSKRRRASSPARDRPSRYFMARRRLMTRADLDRLAQPYAIQY